MLNEQWVTCFLSVANNGSFTLAAEELFLTQQAVSKHVKRLEEELGIDLLKRSTRKVELTEYGERFYQMYLKWSIEYEALKKEIAAVNENSSMLRIGMLSRMNSVQILRIVNQFKQSHKECKVQFVHDEGFDLNRKMTEGEIDLMLTYDTMVPPHDKSLKKRRIGSTGLLLALSENHPKATDDFRFEDMDGEPFIVCLNKGESKTHAMKKAMDSRLEFNLGKGPILIYPEINEVNMNTELGEGFSFCSSSNLFATNPFVRTYPLPYTTVIDVVWKDKTKNKYVKDFINMIPEGDIYN